MEIKGSELVVTGPKGELKVKIHPRVTIAVKGNEVEFKVVDENSKNDRALWGTFSSLVNNMILGVTVGFKRQLEINGVGYKALLKGADLNLEVGFTNTVVVPPPAGIKFTVEKILLPWKARTSSWWVKLPLKFGMSASPSRIRAKALNIWKKLFVARSARPRPKQRLNHSIHYISYMKRIFHKTKNALRQVRHRRVRAKISGTAQAPRLSVFRGLRSITAQLIDDVKGATLCQVRSAEVKAEKGKTNVAFAAGKLLAEKAIAKKLPKLFLTAAVIVIMAGLRPWPMAPVKAV